MRCLLIITIFTSYSIVSCAVSKCYQASNIEIYSSNSTIEYCKPPYLDFCGTATWKNGEVPWNTCGNDEFCTTKRYADNMFCKKPGTFEHDFPGLNNVKLTVTCCDSDMCNVESSAKTLNRTSFRCLIYMSVFCYLYFFTFSTCFCF